MDIAGWLHSLGLERYAVAFRDHDVSPEVLPHLTADDLKELGVTAVGHRRQLLMAIAALPRIGASPMVNDQSGATYAGERRHLTVMFCDLVGSTTLSEKLDPEDLRGLLHDYRTRCGEVIARYDGFVARYVGDGILTYFGWPRAHEDDAERAIRAALEVVDAVKQASATEDLSVHIGIATGPVVVGEPAGTGGEARLAVGSTPNLAARLQGLAAADQIVIAASTRRLIGHAFELTDLGDQHLKGIAEPVHAWRAERVLATESRFEAHRGGHALTPLVGRDAEINLLLRKWSQARDGEGQVMLLSGEPGIGKSRILGALRHRLEAEGVQTVRFQCSPYAVNSAFWPIINSFERTLTCTRDETSASKLDKLEALIVTQYGRKLADVRFVAAILSIPYEQRYGALPITPQKFKDETLRTLVDLIEVAAQRHPSVLLFEDAHWADPTTLEVLDLLIDRVKIAPMLVVLTHRPEFQSRWSGHGHVGALNLSKLTRTQSAAMISALSGGKTLPEAMLEQILTRTDGVPLFVEELTRSILESGELRETYDRFDFAGSARAVSIPATLRDSLMARLDRFMSVREIAQIGAAIGREFRYELIKAVAPMSQAQVEIALDRLCESGLAFRRGTPPDAVYTFKHALVQDAAYDSLLKSHRRDLHGKIAQVIQARFPRVGSTEPELLARHLTAAGLAKFAIPLWHAAGELTFKRMAFKEAIFHLNCGLDLISALPWSSERDSSELELRGLLATCWVALSGWARQEVATNLNAALALTGSLNRNDARLPILWGILNTLLAQGRMADAISRIQEMLDVANVVSDSARLATTHALACTCYCWAGDFTKSLMHADKVQDLYDGSAPDTFAYIFGIDPKTTSGIFRSISTWVLGYPDSALRINEEKDVHARQRNDPFEWAFSLGSGAHWLDDRYGADDLRKRAEECERLGREHALPEQWTMIRLGLYGLALIREAKSAEAIVPLRAGIAFGDASGGRLRSPTMRALLAEAMALSGDLDGAQLMLDGAIAQIERPGWEERFSYAEMLRLKGWILSLNGDQKGAERNYLASLDCARRQRAKMWELRTSISLARLWLAQGKRRDAKELLAPVYNWFTEGFDAKDLLEAKSLLAEVG